jgi:predicted ArsR family transcriptional regulator
VGYEFGLGLGRAEREAGRGPSGPGTTEAVAGVVRLLSRYGFAAQVEGSDAIRARACPFEEVAFGDPERICGLDRAIWRGVLAAYAPGATLSDATSRAGGDEACLVHVSSS